MAFVITQKCVGEVYASCYEVCPVDCIHFVKSIPDGYESSGKTTMIIDPVECIDCGACLTECPVGAIVETESEDPLWTKINAELTPQFKGEKPEKIRDQNEAPLRDDNELVF